MTIVHQSDGTNVTTLDEPNGDNTVSKVYSNKYNDTLVTFKNGTTKSIKITPDGLKTVQTKSADGNFIVTENPDGSI